MKNSAFMAILATSFGLGGSALAQEQSWSGFYAGLETGVARNVVVDHDTWPATWDQKQSSTGALAGAFAGFDQQFGDFVFGGVVDADYVGTGDLVFSGKSDGNYDLNWTATARVRAGWAMNEKMLVYGTGGLALAGIKGQLPGLVVSEPIKSTQTGYVAGLGAEYRFNDNWSVKGEYLHHEFRSISSATSSATYKPQLDVFKVGLAYRF